MDLFLYTGATDLTAAAVASASDVSTAATLPDLVFGDSEELNIYFLSAASSYESWTIAGGYTVTVGLGLGTTDSTEDYVTTSSFTDIANGFSGRLALTGEGLADAIDAQLGANPRLRGGRFVLQVAVTDSQSRRETYAVLPVFVRTSVL